MVNNLTCVEFEQPRDDGAHQLRDGEDLASRWEARRLIEQVVDRANLAIHATRIRAVVGEQGN